MDTFEMEELKDLNIMCIWNSKHCLLAEKYFFKKVNSGKNEF
jgi:hypothetical protein